RPADARAVRVRLLPAQHPLHLRGRADVGAERPGDRRGAQADRERARRGGGHGPAAGGLPAHAAVRARALRPLGRGAARAGARGQSDQMIADLERAVAIQDRLDYIEPPAWFYPVRQSLGAALLQAGRSADAEAVYREDLRYYPNNGWSLFGLAQSLRAQGRA